MQLCHVEEAFRTLKGDLGLRPIFHQKPERIEAHLFVAFLAYCLMTTLRQQLRGHAAGLMPRVVFEKLATIQMLDVCIPTADGRELLLIRHTEPNTDVALLLEKLNLTLPRNLRLRYDPLRPRPRCSPDLLQIRTMNQQLVFFGCPSSGSRANATRLELDHVVDNATILVANFVVSHGSIGWQELTADQLTQVSNDISGQYLRDAAAAADFYDGDNGYHNVR